MNREGFDIVEICEIRLRKSVEIGVESWLKLIFYFQFVGEIDYFFNV